MPTQILRVSVNTVIQQNIFKTTFTYENEYGKYGVFCSSMTSTTYLVLTYYYIHVVRIVVHTSILLRRSITQSSEKAKADAPML